MLQGSKIISSGIRQEFRFFLGELFTSESLGDFRYADPCDIEVDWMGGDLNRTIPL